MPKPLKPVAWIAYVSPPSPWGQFNPPDLVPPPGRAWVGEWEPLAPVFVPGRGVCAFWRRSHGPDDER